MAPTTFAALKAKDDRLVISALDWAIHQIPWIPGVPDAPTDICDSSGDLQALPLGWLPVGEIAEAAGVSLAPDMQTSPVRGYGSAADRRVIPTKEGFTIDYTGQEWRYGNLTKWHNLAPDATVVTAPGKGFRMSKGSALNVFYYSTLLIGRDAGPDGDLFPWFLFPKTSATKRGALAGNIGKEMPLPMTLTLFEDSEFLGVDGDPALYDFGVAGAGTDDLLTAMGFLAAATSITVNPATVTLAVNAPLQLLVLDNNGFDRTDDCTFVSGTPAKATVTKGGRIKAIASGSSTITVTLAGLTPVTCAVTVS